MSGWPNVAPIELENRNEMLQLTTEEFKNEWAVDTYEIFSDKATKAEAMLKQKLWDSYTNDMLDNIRHVDLSPDQADPNKKEIWLYYFYDENGTTKQVPLWFITGAKNWATIITEYLQKDLQKEHTEIMAYVKEVNEALKESKNAEFQLEFEILNTWFVELDRTSGEKDLEDLLKRYATDNDTFDTKKTEKNKAKREVIKTIEDNPAIKITKQKINATKQKREHIESVLKEQQKNKNNPSEIQKRMRQIANIEIQKNINLTKQLPTILDQRINALYVSMQDPNIKVSSVEESFKKGVSDIFTRTQTSGSLAQNIQKDIIDSPAAIEKQFMDTGILPDIFTPTNLPDAIEIRQTFQKILRERVKINIEQHNIDITDIKDTDQQSFKQYLGKVINGTINPATTPFVPSSRHKGAYDNIIKANPALQKYLSTNTSNNNSNTNNSGNTDNAQGTQLPSFENGQQYQYDESFTDKVNVLEPLIDELPISDEYKERLKKVGGIASVIGVGFLWFKAIQGIRKLFGDEQEQKEWLKRLAITGGVLTASYLATWDWLALKKWIEKVVKWSKDVLKNVFVWSHNLETLTSWYSETLDIFWGDITYEELNSITKENNGKINIDLDKYNTRVDSRTNINTREKEDLKEKATALNENNHIDYILTSAGITKEALQDTANSNNNINEKIKGSGTRVQALIKYVENEKLKIDENKKGAVDKYIAGSKKGETLDDVKKALEKLKSDWILIPA